MQLESSVLAEPTTGAGLSAAFSGHAAVDAALTAVEALQGVGLIVLLGCRSLAIANQEGICFFFKEDVSLALQILVLLDWNELGQGVGKQSQTFWVELKFLLSLAMD